MLSNLASVEHDYLIIVSNCVKSVGNGDDSCVLEPLSDHLLHESIGLHVKIRGGLVKEEDFISAEEYSCETNQLLLTKREEF